MRPHFSPAKPRSSASVLPQDPHRHPGRGTPGPGHRQPLHPDHRRNYRQQGAGLGETLKELPQAVSPSNILFINDGRFQVQVETIEGEEVHCRVEAGGRLRSKKGLNLPGIDLGISAFTNHDRTCMQFALENGCGCRLKGCLNVDYNSTKSWCRFPSRSLKYRRIQPESR